MKSSPFITAVANACRIEEKTVRLYARFIREDGLLTQGYSGRGAPDMTPLDAARLTIALLATNKPAEAAKATRKFGDLMVNRMCSEGVVPDFAKDTDWAESFENVLAEFFTLQSPLVGQIHSIEICQEDEEVTMLFENGKTVFDGDITAVRAVWEGEKNRGIRTSRKLAVSDLLELALPLTAHERTPKD